MSNSVHSIICQRFIAAQKHGAHLTLVCLKFQVQMGGLDARFDAGHHRQMGTSRRVRSASKFTAWECDQSPNYRQWKLRPYSATQVN